MKIFKISIIASLLFNLCLGNYVFAQNVVVDSDFNIKVPRPEIYINKDGVVSIVGAKIIQFAGTTIYARVIWDNVFIRVLLKTGPNTNFTRRYGEDVNILNLKVGDYISVNGNLESNADSLNVIADKIKNLSDSTEQNIFSGSIININPSSSIFELNSKNMGKINVAISDFTLIKLGSRFINLNSLKVGDKIVSVVGIYDRGTKTLKAESLEVYINTSIFKAKNHTGILKSISSKTLPTILVVTINSKDYTVKISEKTEIINNTRKPISLSRFIEGDKVVFYGALQESDELIIDKVEIIRNASL